MDQIAELPVLQVKCQRCEGAGALRDGSMCPWADCYQCDGAGFIPTEAGKKVLALVRRHFRAMLTAASDE